MKSDRYPDKEFTYVGADGRQIRRQAKDETGTAIDLTGRTGTISARLGSGSTADYKIEASAITIEVGTSGWWTYTPTAAEVDVKGEYQAQARFVDGTDIDYDDEFILDVLEPIHYVAP